MAFYNTNSLIQNGDQVYPHIWVEHRRNACDFSSTTVTYPIEKPQELQNIDASIWSTFESRLKDLTGKLYISNMKYIWISIFVVVLCSDIIPRSLAKNFDLDKDTSDFLNALLGIVVPLTSVIIIIGVLNYQISKNKSVDLEIKNMVNEMNYQFEPRGYKIDYRTMYTEFCRPKGSLPTRVLVFLPTAGGPSDIPIVEATVVNTNPETSYAPYSYTATAPNGGNKNDDLIDRDAWGLKTAL